MAEDIGEHPLPLICIWQMDNNPAPLVSQNFIILWIIPAFLNSLPTEVYEGLFDRFGITSIGELSIENRSILVNHYFLILEYGLVLFLRSGE